MHKSCLELFSGLIDQFDCKFFNGVYFMSVDSDVMRIYIASSGRFLTTGNQQEK
jgi:hypothetical protein